VLFLMGRSEDAVASIEELLDSIDPEPTMDWAWWIVPTAIVLSEVGRAQEILALGGKDLPSRWIQAARLWASGDLSGAVDRFEEIGSAADEAYARIREAERLVATGRRAEAEPFLARVLELSQGMRATGFISHAGRLLAAIAWDRSTGA
ncbi:MAG: hypothetical protein ABR529_16045, partial [Actinomycetota bacterium]